MFLHHCAFTSAVLLTFLPPTNKINVVLYVQLVCTSCTRCQCLIYYMTYVNSSVVLF